MAHTRQCDVAQDEQIQAINGSSAPIATTEIQILLVTLLKMLEPYVSQANIKLKNGERVSINEAWETSTQFHCGDEKRPCADVEAVEAPNGELFALCKKLARTSAFGAQLETIKSNPINKATTRSRLLPVISSKINKEPDAFRQAVEMRQHIIKSVKDKIRILSAEEKASLLSAFGEREFNSFLEQNINLAQLQSIHYNFTRRINHLKSQGKKQKPRRPVIEQRKVGGFLYKLQSTQKGASYWYIQFTKEGKRIHKYLGKERPSFNPEKDLAKKKGIKLKALAAHV